MQIKINGQQFEETNEIYPISDGVWYKNKWYKPIDQFKNGDWVTFYSEIKKEKVISRIKEWTSHSYCKLENGDEPFKHLIKHALSKEIEEHLSKIVKEKGLVKGAKVKKFGDGIVTIVQEDSNYYEDTDEFAKSGIILYRNGVWVEKVEEPKTYEILSVMSNFPSERGVIITYNSEGKCINRTDDRLCGSTISLKDALKQKEVSIHSVKDLKTGNVYTIGDIIEFNNCGIGKLLEIQFEVAEVDKGTDKICFVNDNPKLGKWWNIEQLKPYKPKFTFGGHEVSFKVINVTHTSPYNFKTVEINCKGETGTHWQIEEILKNYFRPCKFGNVEVKSFTLKASISQGKKYLTNTPEQDFVKIDLVEIGCLTGKYSELVEIYNHCLTLLK